MYTAYAYNEEQYGPVFTGIDDYEVPIIDMFLFLYDQYQEGYVTLDADLDDQLTSLYDTLHDAQLQLQGDDYSRFVLDLSLPAEGQETYDAMDEIRGIAAKYFGKDNVILVGNSTSDHDLESSFASDNIVISVLTALFVMIILFFTFQSAGLPVLLVLTIQGSIWIDLLVFPAHTLTDGGDVVFSLLRTVGDTYAAGEIDEPNVAACLLPKLYRRLEEDTRQCGIIGVGEGVGGQKGVEAEMLGAQSPQLAEALGELRTGKAVFGVSGGVHDLEALLTCPDGEGAAGVVAAGDGFGDGSDGVFQEIDVGEVVQVDGGPQAGGQLKLLRGRIIGGEHDIRPRKAAAVGQHELCEGGAVRTTALFPQELQNGGSGGGLDGKILPVTWIPGKSGLQFSCVFPDAFLVVEVEGSGIPGRDGPELLQGDKRLFQGKTPAF